MKVKALRYKDTHEFIHIEPSGTEVQIFTSEIPKLLPNTAKLESLETLNYLIVGDIDNIELVEFDLIESGEVGADIRNKLTPCFNLIALLKLYFNDNVAHATEKRASLARLIKTEMEKSKESIKYIVNLL